MVVGCHQQPTIAAFFFDNGSHIIGNIPTPTTSIALNESFENWKLCLNWAK